VRVVQGGDEIATMSRSTLCAAPRAPRASARRRFAAAAERHDTRHAFTYLVIFRQDQTDTRSVMPTRRRRSANAFVTPETLS
jgi:uncharacterized protein involved in copper resistance